MLARAHRFHNQTSLRSVYRRGQTVRGPHISLRYNLNDNHAEYRAAVVVSKKVHKSAVKRNRVRRRVYAAIGDRQAEITKPYEFIITVFSDQVIDWSPAKLTKELDSLFRKVGIIKSHN